MLYKVINQFKKEDDVESWNNYIKFSGLSQIEEFCSLDSNLNDSVFTPESEEDWKNCVNEDCKFNMIDKIDYAKKILHNHPGTRIFGLVIKPQNISNTEAEKLLGYDILDGYYSNSLLTNCGGFPDIFPNSIINQFGLLDDRMKAYEIRDKLKSQYSEDAHAKECEVVAVFSIDQ
jgi:hypothetical protein